MFGMAYFETRGSFSPRDLTRPVSL